MLRQSPDIVIGFASEADAEEAGYLPGPSVFGVEGLNISGQPFLLGDGRSMIYLPSTWRHIKRITRGAPGAPEVHYSTDVFRPSRGQGLLMIQIWNEPNNANVKADTSTSIFASPESLKQWMRESIAIGRNLNALAKAQDQSRGGVNRDTIAELEASQRASEQDFQTQRFIPTIVGGYQGVKVIIKKSILELDDISETGIKITPGKGQGATQYSTALKNKAYVIGDYTSMGSGASIIVKSLRPR